MPNSSIISVKDLSAGYGTETVLDGVDFNVGVGEIVSIIGRNGVGKSTLMKTLIGLLKATKGEILFKDKNIINLKTHKRSRLGIGYIPQGRDVFPRMTVLDNLRVGEQLCRDGAKPDYDQVFKIFPVLFERSNQKAGTLSGGQQQQLAIGRVLIGKPDLILLDEPSEGIQPNIVQDIARNIRKMNRDTGLSVLLVEQNIEMITEMSDRAYVIDKGRVIRHLKREEVRDENKITKFLSV